MAVILTALPDEYQAVREHLRDLKEETHPKGTVYEHGYFEIEGKAWAVAIVEIGAGNENAALEAERAINHFSPSAVFFLGVAGGLKDVKIGDVVAASKVYGYERGKDRLEFETRPDVGLVSYSLEQRGRAESKKSKWKLRIRPGKPAEEPRAFVAPIAAGAKVVADTRSSTFQFLRKHYGDAVAVEMEGIGFLTATRASPSVDSIVIRGISDLVDRKTEADGSGSQAMAARHAAAFLFEVLANFEVKRDRDHTGTAGPRVRSNLPSESERNMQPALSAESPPATTQSADGSLPPIRFAANVKQSLFRNLPMPYSVPAPHGFVSDKHTPVFLLVETPQNEMCRISRYPITVSDYIYFTNTGSVPFAIDTYSVEVESADGSAIAAKIPSLRTGQLSLRVNRNAYVEGAKIRSFNASPIFQHTLDRDAILVGVQFLPAIFSRLVYGRTIQPNETIFGWIFFRLPEMCAPAKYYVSVTDTLRRKYRAEINQPTDRDHRDANSANPNDPFVILGPPVDLGDLKWGIGPYLFDWPAP
jgi:nucleoside phosphorylase